ncbi:MAG: Gfo/Idh/MocA family oxidoreductase [Victivallales bacterium]|nr:Gfo/Idh/MocA family oxidoreductase [Victivallales bacterium]
MTKKMKIGVVGLGNVAVNNYLPFLSRQEDVELLYYSRTAEKTEKCVADFGGYACATLRELTAKQPDSILILNRETHHYQSACQLLDFKPKRLFIEKPLHARNGQANVSEQDFFEARDLLRLATSAGTEIAMNFNYRFFEQTLNLKRMIHDKNLGKLRQSSWFVNYACWSHCIDLLHYLGGEITEVVAVSGTHSYGEGLQQGTDLGCAFLTNNGSAGTLLGSSCPAFSSPLYHVVLNFDCGTVTFADLDADLNLYRNSSEYRESYSLNADKSRWTQYAASFEKALASYLDTIRHELPPPVSGMDGLRELQLEAAMRRASATARKVSLQSEFTLDF